MSRDPRKHIHLVEPDEKPRADTVAVSPPSSLFLEFSKRIDATDTAIPILAYFCICAGNYLADQALGFYHSAATHARAGTFRHDLPPGMKSAEATRAWLDTHATALQTDLRAPKYARAAELKAAVRLAADELDRALDATKKAELQFDERFAALFDDVNYDLDVVQTYLSERRANG